MSGRIVGLDGRPIDRNKKVAPMTPFARVSLDEEMKKSGVMAVYQNNKYMVMLRTTMTNGFMVPGDDGKGRPMEIAHVTIMRNDKAQKEIPWVDKQRVKNEILGEHFEAVEIFPSEDRRIKEIKSYHCYLWVFEGGARIPIGLEPARPGLDDPELAISEEDTLAYVVETPRDEPGAPPITEVFLSEEEAAEMYAEAGSAPPEGSVKTFEHIPIGGDGVAWTDAARAKFDALMDKARRIQNVMEGVSELPKPESVRRINVNGPVGDQDDLEDAFGVGDESPKGDEENVMMPEFMKLGIAQIQKSREEDSGEGQDG